MSDESGPTLVIPMQFRYVDCGICGEPTTNTQGVPINEFGEIVSDDFAGKWAARTVCEDCFREVWAGRITRVWDERKTTMAKILEELIGNHNAMPITDDRDEARRERARFQALLREPETAEILREVMAAPNATDAEIWYRRAVTAEEARIRLELENAELRKQIAAHCAAVRVDLGEQP